MRLAELSLRNYRVFEEVDLELPTRVIGIFGPNGAGKSTLMESVLFALYGRARTSKNEIRTQGLLTDCLVRLVFEHGGSQYEVRRSIKGRNHATDAQLFLGDLQLAAGVTEVDTEITKILRMDQQVFRASVFAEQKQLDAFSDVTKGKRKEMVLRLLGIRPVDEARTAAKKMTRDKKHVAGELADATAGLGELEGELASVKEAVAAAKAAAAEAATELKKSEKLAADAGKEFAQADAIRQRVEKIVVALESSSEELAGLGERESELAKRLATLRGELQERPKLEKELDSLAGSSERVHAAEALAQERKTEEKIVRELSALGKAPTAGDAALELKAAEEAARTASGSVAAARANADRESERALTAAERVGLAATADPDQPCPTCGQKLGSNFSAYLAHCKTESAAAKKSVTAAEKAFKEAVAASKRADASLAKVAAGVEALRKAGEARARLEDQLAAIASRVQQLASVFEGKVPDPSVLRKAAERERELEKTISALGAGSARLAESEKDLANTQKRLSQLEAATGKLTAEAEKLSFDAAEYRRLESARDLAAKAAREAAGTARDATAAAGSAELEAGRLQGRLEQAKETEKRAGDVREEARYLERVSLLLDGFRDHLVARIGPELSREAEALFRELTNREYDDLRIDDDTLEIQIADGENYFAIQRFSGSETDLANLALRVAISMHLSRVSGADVGMMVLDEVLGSLDTERKDLMVQALGRLSGRFHQLFVVTHAEQIKDQFPASIEVRMTGRRRSVAIIR